MEKLILSIDDNGFYLLGKDQIIAASGFNENNYPIYEIPKGFIDVPLPLDKSGRQLPFYRPRWTGNEWIEDMSQDEIDELNKPVDRPLSETEILGQQMTERELEASAQGQQITDMDLRLYEMEVSKNV